MLKAQARSLAFPAEMRLPTDWRLLNGSANKILRIFATAFDTAAPHNSWILVAWSRSSSSARPLQRKLASRLETCTSSFPKKLAGINQERSIITHGDINFFGHLNLRDTVSNKDGAFERARTRGDVQLPEA